LQQFSEITPSKYRAMTGKRLGIKNTIALKFAQHKIKRAMGGAGTEIPKGLYIVAAIFGWGWLCMGLMDDWQGKDWWINLILVCICLIPGIVHAFIKMKNYY
jgi:uncharacterized membrane protein YqaE (UPF0057 family)